MLLKTYYWKYIIYSIIFCFQINYSQELNCQVKVNFSLVNQTESKIFVELERSIEEFLNSKKWTNQSYKDFEKINCSFLITVLDFTNNSFKANIEINSFRPVFNSNFRSNNFLFKDNGVNFNYEPNQSIIFSNTKFESDLASILSFYSYIIIGYDNDTFLQSSGLKDYMSAKQILDFSSSFSNSQMWLPSHNGGRVNKFWLIDNLTSSNYSPIKEINYNYHLNGLDLLIENQSLAKQNIIDSLIMFDKMNRFRPNSILQQMFFQSKNDEIFNLFINYKSSTEINNLKDLLNRIAPFYSNKWNKL